MFQTTTGKVGLLLLALGAILVAGPVFGFTSLAADRGVQVNTANETGSAYLGITDVYEGETIFLSCTGSSCDNSNTVSVIELSNNVNSGFDTIESTVVSVESDVLEVANDNELSNGINAGENVLVELQCSGRESGTGTKNVQIRTDAPGASVSVEHAAFTVTDVAFDCEETESAGDGEAADDPVPEKETPLQTSSATAEKSGGTDSAVAFNLENGGESVTITGISVSDAGGEAGAHRINDQNKPEVSITGGGTDGQLNLGTNRFVDIGGPRYDLGTPVTIQQSQTATVEMKQFRNDNGSRIDMNGKDVTFVLYFEDRDPIGFTLNL